MKTWLRNLLEVMGVVLLVPQVFVFCYYFRYSFTGGNGVGLLKALSAYALTISWVSAPYLAALALAVKALIRARARWWVTFLATVAAGYGWVAGWNLLVYDRAFSYAWSALPVLLCSLVFSGYAAARVLYLDSLLPLKLATGGSEEEAGRGSSAEDEAPCAAEAPEGGQAPIAP
jgi:hypothetical protein